MLRASTPTFAVIGGHEITAGNASNVLIRATSSNTGSRWHIEPNGNPSGLASKFDWMFDPYQSDGVNYRIVNIYTKTYDAADASTTQGNNGVGVLGLKAVGRHWGIWPSLHIGFSDDGSGGAVPMKVYYFDTSDTTWRTPMKGGWRSGVSITTGDYMLSANKLYQASTTGTTGATAPTHSSSSASDGGVTWDFVRDFAAASGSIKGCVVFGDRDDLPKFGFANARVQYAGETVTWNGKKHRFLDGSGNSAWSIYTNTGTDDLYIESEDGAKRLRLDATGQFLQLAGLAVCSASVAATDGDTTPSIKGVRLLTINNTGATNITQFDDGVANQEFFIRSGNGNTTLVNGANMVLIGGANKTLSANESAHFFMGPTGAVAYQV